jgi:hypothetical protein
VEFTIRENLIQTKDTKQTGIKNFKQPCPLNEKKETQQKQQTKTTKHTIEFSNNTPA